MIQPVPRYYEPICFGVGNSWSSQRAREPRESVRKPDGTPAREKRVRRPIGFWVRERMP